MILIKKNVFVVTVTYGARRALLEGMLTEVFDQGAARAVVVDNGAEWPVKDVLREKWAEVVTVVEAGRNSGSAFGYHAGIRKALELDADFVWLLDDDNLPRVGALDKLFDAYEFLARTTPADRLAVVGFRPDHQADLAMGVPAARVLTRPNSFCGFHVWDVPYKLWRRTPWGAPKAVDHLPKMMDLEVASYGGLLFHRDLIRGIGLPKVDFVLYVDDLEYTYRIKHLKGRLVLVTEATIDDVDMSWNVKSRFSSGLVGYLKGGGDFRAYYGMRNSVYFDMTEKKDNDMVFLLNKVVYLSLLLCFAIVFRRIGRLRVLRLGIHDGLQGRLGVNDRFPL